MDNLSPEIIEKIRQQFEKAPYPRVPLEQSPKDDLNALYIHNLVTSYYLRYQQVIDTQGKVILDAGCGSGYKALMLAEANPGAKIVGIDISEESVKLARKRLQHHGFENVEFHVLSIYDLASLGQEFDYINNDEVLYLIPDIFAALKAMKSVLKPQGIIRTNLHSAIQRSGYFRAQELFKTMGLMDGNPEDMEIEVAIETMKALKNGVELKARVWNSSYETPEGKAALLSNHLLVGDKGYTIPEMFAALRETELEFLSMVNWRQWNLMSLFKEPDDLPAFLAMSLPEASVEEKLHFYELVNPIHRLLDIWCGHPNQAQPIKPIDEWTESDWEQAQVHLHPQLTTVKVKENLIDCVTQLRIFPISQHLQLSEGFVNIDSSIAVCLLPLLEGTQRFSSLVKRWQQSRPVHPVTLEPTDEQEAFFLVQHMLTQLESMGYILLERKL